MPQVTSTRLPGVPQLQLHFTGPEYSRWRRSIKFALQAKGTWKYCNGNCPMPMPEAAASTISVPSDPQPSLLDERRDWVKHDREAKLDIFLSLSEDVMHEVLEVGPPLPPSNLNAQEMLTALDERFAIFKFEAYHHAFCHFLNLHIDQFPSLEEFNQEFASTLEDLLDHGQPMSNIQACSAYFSKLRCTQNPWVANKLAEWDAQETEPQCTDLMNESPLWSVIRPLATKPSQTFQVESIPEEHLEDSSASDSDAPSESSDSSTTSSISIHSRQSSKSRLDLSQAPDVKRQESFLSARSQEITIAATSEDIAASKTEVPLAILGNDPEAPLPEWLASQKSVACPAPPAVLERPLPPLPTELSHAQPNELLQQSTSALSPITEQSPRSASSLSRTTDSTSRSASSLSNTSPRGYTKKPSQSSLRPQPSAPTLQLETTHPTLRPPLSTRSTAESLVPTLQRPTLSRRTTPDRPSTSSPNLAIPWPSTPDLSPRPSTAISLKDFAAPEPASDDDADADAEDWSLPLQGTRDSAWAYLYESKGGYLVHAPPNSTSPLLPKAKSESLLTQSLQPAHGDTVSVSSRSASPHTSSPLKPLPSSQPLAPKHMKSFSSINFVASPAKHGHKKASSVDFVSRLSGDSILESSEEMRERERERQRKKKSWVNLSVNMNAALAKFQGREGA